MYHQPPLNSEKPVVERAPRPPRSEISTSRRSHSSFAEDRSVGLHTTLPPVVRLHTFSNTHAGILYFDFVLKVIMEFEFIFMLCPTLTWDYCTITLYSVWILFMSIELKFHVYDLPNIKKRWGGNYIIVIYSLQLIPRVKGPAPPRPSVVGRDKDGEPRVMIGADARSDLASSQQAFVDLLDQPAGRTSRRDSVAAASVHSTGRGNRSRFVLYNKALHDHPIHQSYSIESVMYFNGVLGYSISRTVVMIWAFNT